MSLEIPHFTVREFLEYFAVSWLAAGSALAARVTLRLSVDPVPPIEPEALRIWKHRRSWLIAAEFAALPFLSLVAVLATYWSGDSLLVAVGSGIVAGSLGFPFLTHAVETVVRSRLNLPKE